jgi:hypothetical protein
VSFDPDAYLKKKAGGFDPDAYLAKKTPPGKLEGFGRGAAQGLTMGFGDELAGAGAAAQQKLSEFAGTMDPEMHALAHADSEPYQQTRDAIRTANDAAQKEHPWLYAGGQVTGAAPLAMATGGGGAARLIATSAGMGALSGTGESKAETPGGVLEDAAKGGAIGAVLPAAVVGVGKAAPALASGLRAGANATGRRILRNVGGSIGAKVPLSEEAVQEAYNSGVFKPFGTSKGAASRLEQIRAWLGDQKARIVKALEDAGIVGPEADALLQQYGAEATSRASTSMNPSVPRVFESAAEQVGSKPAVNGRLGLQQAEDLKSSLQDMASAAYKQLEPNEVAEAKKAAASMMRQAVENEITQQAAGASPQTQAIAAQFKPLKERLGKIIEASDVANEGVARAANRNKFGILDIMAGSGGFAHGGPLEGAAAAVGSHILRTRGPSTAGVAMQAGANALDFLTKPALTPAQAQTQALIDAILKKALPAASETSGAHVVE